MSPTDDMLWFY